MDRKDAIDLLDLGAESLIEELDKEVSGLKDEVEKLNKEISNLKAKLDTLEQEGAYISGE